MRRYFALISVILLVLTVFVSCSSGSTGVPAEDIGRTGVTGSAADRSNTDPPAGTTAATTSAATTSAVTANTAADQLSAWYSANFSQHAGKYLYDFNNDGQTEMLVFSHGLNSSGNTETCRIDYYSVVNGQVTQLSECDLSKMEYVLCADNVPVGESIEVYANKGNVNVNLNILGGDWWSDNCIIFCIQNDTLTIKVHLLDPGYSIGEGIYNYDDYFSTLAALYCNDENGVSGKYATYDEAVNSSVNPYGFRMIRTDTLPDNNYHVCVDAGYTYVYDYSIYSGRN